MVLENLNKGWVMSEQNSLQNYSDVLSIENLKEILHIGDTTAYKLIREGKIPHAKIGKKIIIPKCAVIEYINSNLKGSF